MITKIGLALGGGGARGLSHIGVLKVLEREHFPVNQITGCSIGALIGGLYAVYQNAEAVEDFIYNLIKRPVFSELDMEVFDSTEHSGAMYQLNQYLNNLKMYFSLLKTLKAQSIYNADLVAKIFEPFPDKPIEELPIPFATIATDLISGREIVISEGSLKKAMMASSAIPGVFPPVKIDNLFLIDGASSDSIPVQIVKGRGAQYVVAVDVTHCVEDIGKLQTGIQIIYRAEDIVTYHLTQERLAGADIVIKPKVRHYSWAAVKNIKDIIKAGEAAAEEALPKLEKILHSGSRQ